MTVKKILFLEHRESDYQSQSIFDGFCRLLGDENIVVYPWKPSFYGMTDTGYKLPDGKYGCTTPPPQLRPRKCDPWSKEKILDFIDEFDLVYIASCRKMAVDAARELWPWIKDKPIVLTDTEDHEDFNEGLAQEFVPKVCFKRCLTPALKDRHPYLNPLPMAACIPDHADWWDDISDDPDDKASYVSARLGNTHPVREKLIFALDQFSYSIYPPKWRYRLALNGKSHFGNYPRDGWGCGSLPYHQYLEEMASSYITFVVRGWGIEALRMWEANLFSVCVFWIYNPVFIYPYPFPDNSVVYINENLQGLEEKLEYYLSNLDEALKIGERGKAHLMQYHTSEERVKYLLRMARVE